MCIKFGMKVVSHHSHTLSFSALCVSFRNWERQLSRSSQASYFQNISSYEGRNPLGIPKHSLVHNAKLGVLKKRVGKIGLDLCGSGRGSLDPQ